MYMIVNKNSLSHAGCLDKITTQMTQIEIGSLSNENGDGVR